MPWAFSLRLDTAQTGRGPRAVPQLRIGRRLLARSRQADDMVTALDQVLGGVLARQDDTPRWLGLRTFVAGDRAVLVDASPPALTADPSLARRRRDRTAHLERRRRRRHPCRFRRR